MRIDVDTTVVLPVNFMPLMDNTDFITREIDITYNESGMDLVWNFETTAGVLTQTAVTPATSGDYEWINKNDGMYGITVPASGGSSINNDNEGTGWFTGICDGVLTWVSPEFTFSSAALNNLLVNSSSLPTDIETLVTRVPQILNLTASGNIGVDWANIENPATAVDLSATDIQLVDTCATNTDMRGTDSASLAATLSTMETTLVAEHGLLQNGIDNIEGGILRIQTSLVDQVVAPSGDNWIKVLVIVNDSLGALFDPADIVDPSGSPVYNGIGATFSDIDDDQVVMYKNNTGTPLDQVVVCHHTGQSNKPQILERDAHGLYYYWMNATASGDALPIGQLKTLFAFFDISQANATYSGTSPFLIQDTDPTSHLHILFAITVSADTGTNERLDEIIVDIADHETARATMQTRVEGTGYDPSQNSLKNIKDRIG